MAYVTVTSSLAHTRVARRLYQAIVAMLVCWCAPALAHKSSDSFLHLTAHGNIVTAQWDIALRDLDAALGLDTNGDGLLSWGEVRQRESQIGAYAEQRLTLRNADSTCTPGSRQLLIDRRMLGKELLGRVSNSEDQVGDRETTDQANHPCACRGPRHCWNLSDHA